MTKKIVGNYEEVVKKMGLPEAFYKVSDDASNAASTIKKDIPRTPFVDFHNRTFDTLIATWKPEDVSKAYTQGDITAASISHSSYINSLSQNTNSSMTAFKTPEDREQFLNRNDMNNLCFAYYNDRGMPCGFSITYSRTEPSLWVAAVIENTTADPEQRRVTTLCSDMMAIEGSEPGSFNDLKQALNSKSIQALLSDIILEDKSVNIDVLNDIGSRVLAKQNIDDKDVRARQFDELMLVAAQILPKATTDDILSRRSDVNFYKYDNFLSTIEQMNQAIERSLVNSETPNRERLVYDMKLTSTAIKLELLASVYEKEGSQYEANGLLLQAQKLRAAVADEQLVIKQVNYLELQQEALADVAKEAQLLGQKDDFERRLSELLILANSPNNEYLSHALKNVQSLDISTQGSFDKALRIVKDLKQFFLRVSNFQTELASAKTKLFNDLFDEGSKKLENLKSELDEAVKDNKIGDLNTELLDEVEDFTKKMKHRINLTQFDTILKEVLKFVGTQGDTLLSQKVDEIQDVTKDRTKDLDFFTQKKFIKASQSLLEIETYRNNLNEFVTELHELDLSNNDVNFKLLKQGFDLVGDIKKVVAKDPNALPKMSEVLSCASAALRAPTDPANIQKLINLSEDASKKESSFWKKLAGSLLMFVGVVLIAAGAALAPVTYGASLALTALGAVGLDQAKAFFDTKKQGLSNSAPNFKTALKELKANEPQRTRTPSPAADSGILSSNVDEESTPPPTPTPTPTPTPSTST